MPEQDFPHSHKLSNSEMHIVREDVKKLLHKGIIVPTTKVAGDFISGVFTRIKKDNSYRMILNLKRLNKFICYNNFKMESLANVINIITSGVYMASVGLNDALYSIPINAHDPKFLFC